jgi:hypothetical protein
MTYKDYPLEECARTIDRILHERPGSAIYQKWTCAGCQRRITGTTPNALFAHGHCEECGYVTDLRKTGCNYTLHMVMGGVADMQAKGNA